MCLYISLSDLFHVSWNMFHVTSLYDDGTPLTTSANSIILPRVRLKMYMLGSIIRDNHTIEPFPI